MDFEKMLEKVDQVVTPLITSLGLELIEREFGSQHGQFVLRLYIDRPEGGITIDDCERVSKTVEDPLESAGIIPRQYTLEVSSPGVDRPLRRPQDFERFIGSRVVIKMKEQVEGSRNFTGLIKGYKEGIILLSVDGQDCSIPLKLLSKAHVKSA